MRSEIWQCENRVCIETVDFKRKLQLRFCDNGCSIVDVFVGKEVARKLANDILEVLGE